MREPLVIVVLAALLPIVGSQFETGRLCFCKGHEAVEPCDCAHSDTIDSLNNNRIFEKVQKLLKKDFFRFYKVNLDKTCPFWPDERQCGTSQCGIAFCDDEVPAGLRRRNVVNMETESGEVEKETCVDAGNKIDPMDRTLHDDEKRQLDAMDHHDDGLEDKFCEIEDDESDEMHYVDLSKNPERYTGYAGKSPQRVWKSIYEENCFKPDPKFDKNFLTNPNNFGMCLEKRVFYRLISGLHSAITISIAAYNYKPPPPSLGQFASQVQGTWFRNTEMFAGRFGTKWSWEGPQRLRNVYFVYLLELKALLKAGSYLQKELFYTGNEKEDDETRKAVEELMTEIRQYEHHFDETEMFTGVESHARALREEFRSHFVNISRIMDCVECDKCRLWGKVQTHGMGTALKILFADLPHSHKHDSSKFQLTRNEVVALLQSFGRYSSSIMEVSHFRQDMYPEEEESIVERRKKIITEL